VRWRRNGEEHDRISCAVSENSSCHPHRQARLEFPPPSPEPLPRCRVRRPSCRCCGPGVHAARQPCSNEADTLLRHPAERTGPPPPPSPATPPPTQPPSLQPPTPSPYPRQPCLPARSRRTIRISPRAPPPAVRARMATTALPLSKRYVTAVLPRSSGSERWLLLLSAHAQRSRGRHAVSPVGSDATPTAHGPMSHSTLPRLRLC